HDPRLATIGVTLATSAQGRGYASEAVTWLLDYLFSERSKHRVTADCDVRNDPIVALLERLQIRREARHLQSAWWKDEWVDGYVYAILAHEWLERRPSLFTASQAHDPVNGPSEPRRRGRTTIPSPLKIPPPAD
ncbi:MAG: GNAT family protein, partial [Dehalococcoidia bacterium]